ncbi:DedA family protein [Vulgatibacter incomptus]|uniref:DedA family protein n=1 Tax=Vulgatibacter incomptus TaxID=1391653 RepID=A0A0K1PAD5_9BACT|nr:DedA family protein [Vulgatibacter incomptus]AKU90498.1 DedA family protein [Vulgatibacter incomptus]
MELDPVLAALVQSLIEEGSYVVFFVVLLAAGLGAPVAEELVVLAAGALARQEIVRWWAALLVCFAGVIAGDSILFLTARKLGKKALEHRRFQKLLPPERREKLEDFYERRGGLAVFVGRHIPGVRAPLFALAGIHEMEFRRFLFWDAASACINTPFLFWLGWTFSDQFERIQKRVAHVEHLVVLFAVAAFAIYAAVSYWRSTHGHPVRETKKRWRRWRGRRRHEE